MENQLEKNKALAEKTVTKMKDEILQLKRIIKMQDETIAKLTKAQDELKEEIARKNTFLAEQGYLIYHLRDDLFNCKKALAELAYDGASDSSDSLDWAK